MSRLFRILNDNETIGVVYDSKEHTSPRKQEIIRLWDTLKAVCRFSKETGISLQTAYNTGMKIMDGTERLSDDQGDVIISNYPNHGKRFYTEMKRFNRIHDIRLEQEKISMGGGMGNRSFGIIPESTKQTAFHQLLSGYRERHAILPIW